LIEKKNTKTVCFIVLFPILISLISCLIIATDQWSSGC